MRRDRPTAGDRSPAYEPRGTGAAGKRLRRFLALFGPSLSTVGALFALAVVAPDAGFLALLLVTVGGGLALASADEGVVPPVRAVFEGGAGGIAGGSGTATQRAFLLRYLWGLAGFGAVGLALTVLFLV
jgi:hypothetical protein